MTISDDEEVNNSATSQAQSQSQSVKDEVVASGTSLTPSDEDEDIAMEEVDTHATSASTSAARGRQPMARAATTPPPPEDVPSSAVDEEEMHLEPVDVGVNEHNHDHEDGELELEQVDVGGSGNDENADAYAAAYEAARIDHDGGDAPAQPIFKDGKGQPGGIAISLSSAQAGKKGVGATTKKGAVVTTRDRQTRLATHKWMVLALLAHTRTRNELLNHDALRDDLYALIPNAFLEKLRAIHPKKVPVQNERIRQFEALLRELTKWWSYKFRLDPALTTLGALRQPDADLLSGAFPAPGRRVDGWVVESARQRQERQRETRQRDEERRIAAAARKANESRDQGTSSASKRASSRRNGKNKHEAPTHDASSQHFRFETDHKSEPRPPCPDITLFGPGNSTTPVYLRLAEPREATRTVEDLLARVHAMSGSREISAQLFAALCRSLGIPSRLVISVQVPSWSISASKVASTSGVTGMRSKGGALAKRRKLHHEDHVQRRQLQDARKGRSGSRHLTSDEESFHNTSEGNTSDEFHGTPRQFRRKVQATRGSKTSQAQNVASTASPRSSVGSDHDHSIGKGRSTRATAQVNGARKAAAQDASEETLKQDEKRAKQNGDQEGTNCATNGGSKDSDYRAEKWRGLDEPLDVEYKPKLRIAKPKPLKESELAATAQPDIEPVDVLAPPSMWVEVFSKPWQKWITVDPVRGLVEPTGNRQMEPSPNDKSNRLVYVMAFEEDGYARDVTPRYTKTLHSRVSRMRPPASSKRSAGGEDFDWWSRVAASLHRPQKLDRDAAEDMELEGAASREPMPTSVAAFKDHPVYALEKHLKRDEVIHPLRQAGTFQGMPVFLRNHVVSVKSARQWYNEGRVIKEGEEALKWVKSRGYTLANKRAEEEARQQGLEGLQEGLYALFQTELYRAPPVVDGCVPTNSFGNIDLFVESMLPPGAAHIPYNGAGKVARHLGIHYAEAITGFEFRKHRSMPRLTGIVVAEENSEAVLEAYWTSEHVQAEREVQKRQERLFKNWKKLLNALKIQERLRREYGTGHGNRQEADEAEAEKSGMSVDEDSTRHQHTDDQKRLHRLDDEEADDDLRAYEHMHAADPSDRNGEGMEDSAEAAGAGGGFLVE